MPQNIEINWNSSITIESVHYPKDTLDRSKYAQYLTNFLASKGYDVSAKNDDKKRNYVLNLNSEWGSGKTYFLRRWTEDLKARHPVVYVDAWLQDYSDDPLMTVISSMTKQLREQAGKAEDKTIFSVAGKAGGLFKALAPAIIGGVTKKFTGIDFAAVMNDAEEANKASEVKDEDDKPLDMSAAASKAVQYMLDEHDGKAKAISALKESVSQWLEAVISLTDKNYPAFVLIDELDRCRPSYAVEMLETIKHIFNIKGVVFVVATDTEQLQHAVKAVYGLDFDAGTYLGRFFDARYTLRQTNYEQLLEVHCDLNKISMSGLRDSGLKVWPKCAGNDKTDTNIDIEKRNLSTILRAFGLSAREAIQVMERLASAITNMRQGSAINLYYLVILMCIKEKYPEFFIKLHKKTIFSGNAQSEWNLFAHNLFLGESFLEIHIDTNSFITEFVERNHGTTVVRKSVYLPADTTVTLSQYFFFTHSSMLTGFIRENIYSELERANRNANSIGESLTKGNLGNWLQYGSYLVEEYCVLKDEGNGKNSPIEQVSFYERYKDIVELSTALDV
ncbi:TPA: NTPase KAP [Vibrio cholerae]|uniref:KAP family P-loop NTPase fold protein n=1 Tax=Vibrio cholerae TaxID=666 RepID=UPI0020855FF2|nr:P-loop NTPase fold protein [Vibrio cholerae]EJY0881604.1 NTPase KAP [Vibrio cholerae]ELL7122346.1 NTPase KAP [Vibrio cholerae]MCR9706502.1 KAP family NTPase [Vibrio cholerae]GIA46228.1 KAP family P-loop domain protein [Vibrio cholerae]HDI3205177.1 NTPase KAP [Vibrio cholerae]